MTRGGGLAKARRAAPFLLLAACSSPSDRPAGQTADDRRQLNDAAEMLDANAMAPRAVTK